MIDYKVLDYLKDMEDCNNNRWKYIIKSSKDYWHYIEEADYPIEHRYVLAMVEDKSNAITIYPVCVIYVNGIWQQYSIQEHNFQTLNSLIGDSNFRVIKWQYINY